MSATEAAPGLKRVEPERTPWRRRGARRGVRSVEHPGKGEDRGDEGDGDGAEEEEGKSRA
jgi:hypothetical protein